tara:strand:+ start:824 stop:1066 length:243 start_codon:yes stop_codon:yes gene_type:complete
MNGKKAKVIRRRAIQEMIDWYRGLLGPEEADKVSKDNIFELIPKQTHIRKFNQIKLSVYSYKWFIKIIKRGGNPKDFING